MTVLGQCAVAATIACIAAGAACAQTYPVKPLRMVVPFAPGGGTDVIARYIAAGMSESMNRQVIGGETAFRLYFT